MGTSFFIGCHDCKEFRDLDKFYDLGDKASNRKEALELAEGLKENTFRCALLVSFLGKHFGHKCFVFTEQDAIYENIYGFMCEGEDWKYESREFWDLTEEEKKDGEGV